MNKLKAIAYSIGLLFLIIARFFSCLFDAILESRMVSLSFAIEVFKHSWNDPSHMSIEQHFQRIAEIADEE
jgi:hypothetical protein